MTAHRTGRVRATLMAGALALSLGACGVSDALVGLHPAPGESPRSAPLDVEAATAVAARVLGAAEQARSATGPTAKTKRADVLVGDALTLATLVRPATATEAPLTATPEPTVLAMSSGRAWPRAMLVGTLDEATATQYLHVLVSATAEEAYRLVSTAPMLPGATLPALGPVTDGASYLTGASKETIGELTPAAAVTAYASALTVPRPAKVDKRVAVTDAFSGGLLRSAAAQAKALGKLATLGQAHKAAAPTITGFRLADGGAVLFTLLTRTDAITVKAGAKEILLPAEYKKLTGKAKATKAVTLTSLEPVILLVSNTGTVSVIGAAEHLIAGKAS